MKKFVVCITGASGFIYGKRLVEELSKNHFVHLVVSNAAYIVMEKEEGITKSDFLKSLNQNVEVISNQNIGASVSSGSYLTKTQGVIVAPCSMDTLAAVANGVSSNLIQRVCDVALKERKKLLLLVREMPFSLIHIENMRKVMLAGGIVASASPGFYNKPKTVDDMVNFVIGKVLDIFEVEHNLYKRWEG
ncbi:phenylacrylic acid decarboxylase (PAD) [Sulfurihydrogenibium azorense Az-Fu1]|uniref:Flavin prenyltransferase UbiX n=1 Tax=Sulfurihydrogenibium azorense (strain DSM 15241 / OCM 825 / Az-Fu1) TaxID=204536 RepID=C1DWA9_SULAA|nr:UbiX family flavin prenyltransferase [Sulfurihydrogenibium azorense]ACN99818.1 phenylacrylic acid decarboxylase (PAD) [Sulfurihydrogenibium azorense Az-Fu1]